MEQILLKGAKKKKARKPVQERNPAPAPSASKKKRKKEVPPPEKEPWVPFEPSKRIWISYWFGEENNND